jgi:hypothetical protein
MPRYVGSSTNKTQRWNKKDKSDFHKRVSLGIIDIDNISPAFIDSIRDSHPRWKLCSIQYFRTNYQRVANTLRLARDLDSAQARNSEIFSIFSLSHCLVFDTILLTTLLAKSNEDEEADDNEDSSNGNDSTEEENEGEGEEADDDESKEEENEAIDDNMPPKLSKRHRRLEDAAQGHHPTACKEVLPQDR